MKQFLKFGLVGISNTLISEAIYVVIICLKGHYLLASTTGFVLSVFNAYYWNNKYVFREDDTREKRVWWQVLLKTFLSYLWGFVANLLLLAFWIDIFKLGNHMEPLAELLRGWNIRFLDAQKLGSLLAEGINLILVLPMNFFLNKCWAFRQKQCRNTDKE